MSFIFKVPPPPSNAWKLQLASYDNVSFVATEAQGIYSATYGMYVQPSGNSFYIADQHSRGIRQYNMSTPWDLSTSSVGGFAAVDLQEIYPTGVTFKPDGTKMYVIGSYRLQVFQYSLSTAWDLGTVSYDNVAAGNFGLVSPKEAQFSPDGLKMFLCDSNTLSAYQYSLTSPWYVGGATYDNISYNIIDATGMFFREDGKKLYSIGGGNDTIYQHSLSNPWDLSSASYDNIALGIHSIESGPSAIGWKPDGLKFFVIGATTQTIYQFSIPVA